MAVDLGPYLQFIIFGLGRAIVQFAGYLYPKRFGMLLLILGAIMFLVVAWNFWYFPMSDEASEIGGRFENDPNYIPPGFWEHVAAFACVAIILYSGLRRFYGPPIRK